MFCLSVDPEIELCLFEDRHAEALFKLVDQNRIYLREWLPWLDANTSVDDTKTFIKSTLEQFAGNNGFQCGILYKNHLVGVIGYHKIDWANRAAGIGYWLSADAQGQGIITRACRCLVNYAFTELKLNRIEIRCATGNHKSCAIPHRLGFTKEGIHHQAEWLYDHYVDHVIYSVLAEAWAG